MRVPEDTFARPARLAAAFLPARFLAAAFLAVLRAAFFFLAAFFFAAGFFFSGISSTHLPSRKYARQPVALPSFSVMTYCSRVLRRKRTIDLFPSRSSDGASAR